MAKVGAALFDATGSSAGRGDTAAEVLAEPPRA
jgi:hypothetical protein